MRISLIRGVKDPIITATLCDIAITDTLQDFGVSPATIATNVPTDEATNNQKMK